MKLFYYLCMKAHLIKKKTIVAFIRKNPQSNAPFIAWFSTIKRVNWNVPFDIISTFNSADILGKGSERVVFNIGGNKYRMICRYHFGMYKVHVFIKWIETHAEYTKLCLERKQYTVDDY